MHHSIPSDVQSFLVENIGSVEMLHVLLMLFARPDRAFTAAQVGQDCRTNAHVAQLQLDGLGAKGLVERVAGESVSYRALQRFNAIVEATRKTFAERRVAVITLIYSRPGEVETDPTDPVGAFADAFKLRKDK